MAAPYPLAGDDDTMVPCGCAASTTFTVIVAVNCSSLPVMVACPVAAVVVRRPVAETETICGALDV